jgi:hypothetical protein
MLPQPVINNNAVSRNVYFTFKKIIAVTNGLLSRTLLKIIVFNLFICI